MVVERRIYDLLELSVFACYFRGFFLFFDVCPP